jgi:ammonia channel protein AmtB
LFSHNTILFIAEVILKTTREHPSDSALFLSVLIWATAGYEVLSKKKTNLIFEILLFSHNKLQFTGILAQQTRNPSSTYPRVMLMVILMMITVYATPVFLSLTTYRNYELVKTLLTIIFIYIYYYYSY